MCLHYYEGHRSALGPGGRDHRRGQERGLGKLRPMVGEQSSLPFWMSLGEQSTQGCVGGQRLITEKSLQMVCFSV